MSEGKSGGPPLDVRDQVKKIDDSLPKDEKAKQTLMLQVYERQDFVAKELGEWRAIGKELALTEKPEELRTYIMNLRAEVKRLNNEITAIARLKTPKRASKR